MQNVGFLMTRLNCFACIVNLPWRLFFGTLANSADADQRPHIATSGQVLHSLLSGFSMKSMTKMNHPGGHKPDRYSYRRWLEA